MIWIIFVSRYNQTLEDCVFHIQQFQQETNMINELNAFDPQPLLDDIWKESLLENFKPPSLAKFDECSDPYKHVTSINTQMATIGATNSMKCKLLSCTFRDATMRWYTCLSQVSLTSYLNLVKKLIPQFTASRHRELTSTSLFNILPCPLESLREYLTHFKEVTIKVICRN